MSRSFEFRLLKKKQIGKNFRSMESRHRDNNKYKILNTGAKFTSVYALATVVSIRIE